MFPFRLDRAVLDVFAPPLGAVCDSGGPGAGDGPACREAAVPSRARLAISALTL